MNAGPAVYKCYYCVQQNLTETDLIAHTMKYHGNQKGICPICSISPGGEPNYESENLLAHL